MKVEAGIENKTFSPSASVYLDIIRIMSSQLVVIGHGFRFAGIFSFMGPPSFPYLQKIAVVIFFFLSGFLVSSSVFKRLKNTNYSFIEYCCERFARIYSAFFPSLIFVAILDTFCKFVMPDKYFHENSFTFKSFLGNLLMLQDTAFPFQVTTFASAKPLWSLAIEWWIYLLFGCLVLVSHKNMKDIALKVFGIFLFGIVPYYSLTGRGNGLAYVWVWGALFAMLYLKYHSYLKLKQSLIFIAGSVVTVTAAWRVLRTGQPYEFKFGYLISSAFFIWFIYFNNIQNSFKETSLRIIKIFAGYSFTLYLTHYSIMDFLRFYLEGTNPYLVFFLSFLVSNIISYILARYTENKSKVLLNYLKNRIVRKAPVLESQNLSLD
jgi:peptidoglycan/LPS O-acetylase OafA/YrhL